MQRRGANRTLPLGAAGLLPQALEPLYQSQQSLAGQPKGHRRSAREGIRGLRCPTTQNGRSCAIRVPGSLIVDAHRRSLPSAAWWQRLDLKPRRQRPVRRPAALRRS